MAYYFSTMANASLYAVGFASPLASFASNILALIYLASGRWRKKASNGYKKSPLKGLFFIYTTVSMCSAGSCPG